MSGKAKVFEIASWPFELDSCAFVSIIMARSMTTERLNLWSANDFVLARCGFVRFIALRCMFIWCFVSTCKSSSSNSVYKIPCKNDLREISMTAAYHHTGVFSIKNPTIESEVSWSSLLSFYTLEEQSLQQYATGMNEKEIESADLSSWFWTKLFSFEMNVFNAFLVNKMLT